MTSPAIHGTILGPLNELHPDRIVVGGRTLFLGADKPCPYGIGMILEVVYTEWDGRGEVVSITPFDRRQRPRSSPSAG